jgi:hypothetical protein
MVGKCKQAGDSHATQDNAANIWYYPADNRMATRAISMNMTTLRVALYFMLPVLALMVPWVSFDEATGLLTITVSVEAVLASLGGAGVAVAGIYAKWGKS